MAAPMFPIRRSFLRGLLAAPMVGLAATADAGFFSPSRSPARSEAVAGLLNGLRDAVPELTHEILVKAPDIAEDGASVFIEMVSVLPAVDGILIFADRNPQPLVAAFHLGPGMLPELKTRIKVAQTGNVWVVMRSQGRYYRAFKQVKVTIGGCGAGLN